MERLRNKKRLAPTPLDELCDELSAMATQCSKDAAKFSEVDTQEEWNKRLGRWDAVREILELARAKQRTQR